MRQDIVLLSDIATEFGIDKSNARKYVLKEGFEFIKTRTEETRGQETLALTEEDANAIRTIREEQGYVMYSNASGEQRRQIRRSKSVGYFYIIQLVPDLKPERVKLGFAQSIENRFGDHRVAAPTAEILRTWPCKRTWERAVIDSVTQEDCNPLSTESFDCGNLDKLVKRVDDFFQLMPIDCLVEQLALPEPLPDKPDKPDENTEEFVKDVRKLHEEGISGAEIQRRVFGSVGGGNFYRLKNILESQ